MSNFLRFVKKSGQKKEIFFLGQSVPCPEVSHLLGTSQVQVLDGGYNS